MKPPNGTKTANCTKNPIKTETPTNIKIIMMIDNITQL